MLNGDETRCKMGIWEGEKWGRRREIDKETRGKKGRHFSVAEAEVLLPSSVQFQPQPVIDIFLVFGSVGS